MSRKVWIAEAVIIVLIIIASIGKKNVIIFDESNTEVFGEGVVYCSESHSYSITDADIDSETDLSQGYVVIGNRKMQILPGAYEVTINYVSQTDVNDSWGNCSNKAGWVQIRSYDNPSNVKYNTIELVDGYYVQKDRMWITSLKAIEDLDFKVFFNGIGSLEIVSMTITELPIWRIVRIFICILVLAFGDWIYLYVFKKNNYQNKEIVMGMLAIIFVSSLPVFNDFIIGGHDLPFHLSRILSLGRTLENGRIWDPIEYDMVNGYGYANPLFYGQLFLYIPAFLYLFAIPIHTCYQIYVICINTASCIIGYFCCKAICKNEKISLFGAFLYTFSAYRLSNVYIRAAVGEYTAMVFIPLVVLGFWKVYTAEIKKIKIQDYVPIVIGLTGLLHSHVLSAEIVAIFIGITCILLIKRTIQKERFLALAKAAVLTIFINLGYLIPFLDAMQMNTIIKTEEVKNIQESGAYLLQLFGVFMTPSGKSLEQIKGDMPINLGFSLFMGLLIFVWCVSKQYDWKLEDSKQIKTGSFLLFLTVLAIIFSSVFFPWDSIKLYSEKLGKYACMIQFPWRYLSIATILSVLVTVIGITCIYMAGKKEAACIMAIVLSAFTLVNGGLLFMQYADVSITTRIYADTDKVKSIENIYGGEYLLEGTDMAACVSREVILGELVEVSDFQSDNGITSFQCINNSSEPKTVDIPVFNYKHYCAYDRKTGERLSLTGGGNNRIAVVIPGNYSGIVEVRYVVPTVWYIGNAISLITIVGSVIVVICRRKRSLGVNK